jgi:ABC-type xylose transport system substrate-binding protein
LQSEGDFKRNGVSQLSDTISRTNGDVVFNLDAPSSSTDLQHLVDLCTSHKVYFVTQNNMPPSRLRPWMLSPYYVAHIDFDHKLAGFKTARELITLMGGQGGILALGGKIDNPFALRRLSGLEEALSTAPRCYMLDKPMDAEWEASAGYDIMRSLIAEHGIDQIGGVWAANDDMALGAIEALRLIQAPRPRDWYRWHTRSDRCYPEWGDGADDRVGLILAGWDRIIDGFERKERAPSPFRRVAFSSRILWSVRVGHGRQCP